MARNSFCVPQRASVKGEGREEDGSRFCDREGYVRRGLDGLVDAERR